MNVEINAVEEFLPRTKTHMRIIEAVDRGYSVSEDGEMFGPKGKIKVSLYGKQRYPTFSTNWGSVFGIPVHMFAAYVFYGSLLFDKTKVVRHLNGLTLDFSKSNIVLGTPSENELDKDKETRVRSAKAGRASQGIRPSNSKLTDGQVREIKEFFNILQGRRAGQGDVISLALRMGVSSVVLYKIKNGEYYKDVI